MICPVCESSGPFKQVEKKWEYSIMLCPHCDVEFSDPMKSHPEEYEKIGGGGSDKRISFGYRRRFDLVGNYVGWDHREFVKFLEETYGSNRAVSIAEIGCGTGDFAAMLTKGGWNIAAYDLDKKAVEAGRAFHGIENIRYGNALEIGCGGMTEGCVDILCFFAVLEHLEAPGAFIEDAKKIIAPGGLVVFSVPSGDSRLQKLYRRLTKYIDYPPQHLTRWKEKSIDVFLEKHGFERLYYSFSAPTFTDIVSDMIKLFTPDSVSTEKMLKFQQFVFTKITHGLDKHASRIDHKGRSQMVIARKKPVA